MRRRSTLICASVTTGKTAGVRRPSLHQRAGIGEAPGHDAVVGSGDSGVVAERGVVLLIGFRHFQLLLGGAQRGLGGFYLRLGCAVFGGGVVEFLLGDQSRPRFVGVDQAHSVGMQSNIVGLGTGHVTLRALNFFLGMMHRCFGLIDLGHQFGDLQHSEHLSLVDVVANVDVNVRM